MSLRAKGKDCLKLETLNQYVKIKWLEIFTIRSVGCIAL